MYQSRFDRRQLLKGALLGIVPLSAARPGASQAALAPLAEDDPTAKVLAYHVDAQKVDARAFPTFKPAQTCANCSQLQIGSGNERGCNLFPGKSVNVAGWCKVWMQQP